MLLGLPWLAWSWTMDKNVLLPAFWEYAVQFVAVTAFLAAGAHILLKSLAHNIDKNVVRSVEEI